MKGTRDPRDPRYPRYRLVRANVSQADDPLPSASRGSTEAFLPLS